MVAGWYRDPRGPGARYWDGIQWTGHHTDDLGRSQLDVLHRLDATDERPVRPPARQVFPAVDLDIATAPAGPSRADERELRAAPVPGWWLCLLVAACGVLSVFLPIASFDGEAQFPYKDAAGDFAWPLIWPPMISAAVLAWAGLSARRGWIGALTVGAGAALLFSAFNIIVGAFLLELIFAFDDAGLGSGSGFEASPHAGFVVFVGSLVGGIALGINAARVAFKTERGTAPVLLSVASSLAAGYVFVVLADGYFEDGSPVFGEAMWINVATVMLFVPLAAMAVLPLVTRNTAAAGLSAGFAMPLAVLFVVLIQGTATGVGLTDGAGTGMAVLAMAAVGLFTATRYGRRMVQSVSGTRHDVAAPAPALAVVTLVVAGCGFVYVLSSVEDEATTGDPYAFSTEAGSDSERFMPLGGDEAMSRHGSIAAYGDERVWWTAPSSGEYVIDVYGSDGLDPTVEVFDDGYSLGYNDDGFGTSASSLSLYLDGGEEYEFVIVPYGSTSGDFELVVRTCC